jgi:large subunit ribosomal protein L19
MRHPVIIEVEKSFLKQDLPDVRVGDSVSVAVKIIEGTKQRIQKFDGMVLAINGTGTGKTITVRKISSGVGVERVFLIHSPLIEAIKILSTGKALIRRSKLYYMRERQGKNARIKYKVTSHKPVKSSAS